MGEMKRGKKKKRKKEGPDQYIFEAKWVLISVNLKQNLNLF